MQIRTLFVLTAATVFAAGADAARAQCDEPWFEPRVIADDTIIDGLDANDTGWLELATTNRTDLTVWTLDDGPEPTPTPVYTGSVGSGVVTDFDNDGRDDIAIITGNPTTLRVFKNTGNAWPEISALPIAGDRSSTLLALDIFDDGTPDLVYAHRDSIDLLLNDGSGTFSIGAPIARENTWNIWVANVNADPGDDLVLAFSNSSGDPIVYLQQPDGSFAAGPEIGFSPSEVGDITGDGMADLVLDTYDFVALAPALGDGSFGEPDPIITDHVTPVLLADLDADGDLDLLVRDFTPYDIVPYLNQGAEGFTSRPVLPSAPYRPLALDVNRDGIADLVGSGSSGTAIFRGRGDGSFVGAQDYEATGRLRRLAVADLDGDGDQDAVVVGDSVDGPRPGIVVLMNTGAGQLELVTAQAGSGLDRDDTFEAPILADFDADGDLDIAFWSGNEIVLIEHTPDGLFSSRRTLPAPDPCLGCQLLSSDFDGNGFPDLTLLDEHLTNTIRLIFNEGSWSFSGQTLDVTPYQAPIGITDATGDGLDDIILSTDDSDQELAVLPSRGNGSFNTPITSDVTQDATWAFPGDFDGDGDQDLLVVKYARHDIVLLRNDSSGRFEDLGAVARYTHPRGIGVADLNNDGFDDFIAGSQTLPESAIYFSNGDGSFSDGTPIWIHGDTVGGMVTAVATDMNSDGSLDLVLAGADGSGQAGKVTVELNQCGAPDCRVDLNADSLADTRDLVRFLQLWAGRFTIADWNHDGAVDTADFLEYLNDWTAGC